MPNGNRVDNVACKVLDFQRPSAASSGRRRARRIHATAASLPDFNALDVTSSSPVARQRPPVRAHCTSLEGQGTNSGCRRNLSAAAAVLGRVFGRGFGFCRYVRRPSPERRPAVDDNGRLTTGSATGSGGGLGAGGGVTGGVGCGVVAHCVAGASGPPERHHITPTTIASAANTSPSGIRMRDRDRVSAVTAPLAARNVVSVAGDGVSLSRLAAVCRRSVPRVRTRAERRAPCSSSRAVRERRRARRTFW